MGLNDQMWGRMIKFGDTKDQMWGIIYYCVPIKIKYRVVSSAKSLESKFNTNHYGRSLIKIEKNSGSRTEPCGTQA